MIDVMRGDMRCQGVTTAHTAWRQINQRQPPSPIASCSQRTTTGPITPFKTLLGPQICRSGKHKMIAEQDRARRGSLSPRRCAAPPGAPPSGSRASRIGQPSRLPAVRWTERQEATSAAVWATHEHCAVSCAQRRDAPSGAWSKRARLHRYRRLIRRCRPHLHQLPHGRCGWHRTHTRACLPAHT